MIERGKDRHQLRAALDCINPDGDEDTDQLDDWLTFGIVQHKDDGGAVSTGMCCWNDDTDGVLPLDGEYAAAPAAPIAAAQVQEEVRNQALSEKQKKVIESVIVGLRDGWAKRQDADAALAILGSIWADQQKGSDHE